MKDKDYSNLGNQIKNLVTDAISNMDYDQLNKNIGKTVGQALEEMKKGMDFAVNAKPSSKEAKPVPKIKKEQDFPMNLKPISNKQSVLRIGFGIIGCGTSAIISAAMLLWGSFWNGLTGAQMGPSLIASGVSFLVAVGFLGLVRNGMQIRGRKKRLDNYLALMDGKAYADLKILSTETKDSLKLVRKDFECLIKSGVFPEGVLNMEKTYFMGNKTLYNQYLISLQERAKREETLKLKEAREDSLDESVKEAVKKGREFISHIREANLRLPAEVISKKLDRLELITEKIFGRVTEKPGQLPQIRRFMEYYLPTTQKLVVAYETFENEPLVTENIQKSKKEIENTLDTINDAFEALYDNLMEEDIMDLSSDISVLNTMLAQEGLKKDNLK